MLNTERIHRYVRLLRQRADVDVLLVGGAAEAEKAKAIQAVSGPDDHIQTALTPTSIPEFVAILMQVDVLLCGDTLALHIATAIGLPTVAVFGPTSAAEIADFGGLVAKTWTPALDCLGCYGDCDKAANCMSLLDLEHVAELTVAQLSRRRDHGRAA